MGIDIKIRIRNIFLVIHIKGYRRIKHSLKKKVVRNIMNSQSLVVINIKKRKYSSYLGEISPRVPNFINRSFKSDKPNEKLLTDLVEFAINGDKVYLSPMIDCFNGYVLS